MPLSSFLGRRIWCQHAAFGACRRFLRRRNQPPACVHCEQLSAVFPHSCTARVQFLYGACLPLCIPYPQLTFTTSTHDTPNFRHSLKCSLQVLVSWWGQAAIFAITVFADATGREWKRAQGMALRKPCHSCRCPRLLRKACVPLRKPCMAGMHGVGQGFQQTHSLHSFEDPNQSIWDQQVAVVQHAAGRSPRAVCVCGHESARQERRQRRLPHTCVTHVGQATVRALHKEMRSKTPPVRYAPCTHAMLAMQESA